MTLRTTESPEESELRVKLSELRRLEQQLADAELSLVTLRTDLSLFERRYLRIVGLRLAELDEIEAAILQQRSKDSRDGELLARARDAAARADASRRAASSGGDGAPPPIEGSVANDELRQLYRDVARRVHPDLAPDESARAARTEFMARANKAYAERDEIALTKLFEEWSARPEEVVGDSVGAQLVRTIRRIAQAKRRLTDIEAEMTALAASPLATLSGDVATAAAAGRDLIAEMAERLDAEAAAARVRLRRARGDQK